VYVWSTTNVLGLRLSVMSIHSYNIHVQAIAIEIVCYGNSSLSFEPTANVSLSQTMHIQKLKLPKLTASNN